MTSLLQWNLLKTLQKVENRLCVDCNVPLTKSDTYGSNFGTWICSACSLIHQKLLGEKNSYKHALNDHWTDDEVHYLLEHTDIANKGNLGFNEIHEKYIPNGLTKLTPTCTQREREFWIKAKYCYNLFMIPCQLNNEVTSSARSNAIVKKKKKINRDGPAVLPSRIIDYFLVISATNDLSDIMNDNSKSILEKISNLELKPGIQTCFPSQDTHTDMQIPDMLGSFVFPYGFKFSHAEKQPMFFTFVLTDVNGVKLYGATLHIHELLEPQELSVETRMPPLPPQHGTPVHPKPSATNGKQSPNTPDIPSPGIAALLNTTPPDQQPTLVFSPEEGTQRPRRPSGMKKGHLLQEHHAIREELWPVLYAPKALVLLSHYPFFHLFKEYLECLYRISLSLNYIPLERYIINFVGTERLLFVLVCVSLIYSYVFLYS